MESLPRNGSYVERRKVYADLPFHNLKSSLPIDWSTDAQPTYERHRSIAKELTEREYIKQTYDQRMDRKIRERYRGEYFKGRGNEGESGRHDGRDVLMRELEQFNTSKVIPTASHKNNPENGEPTAEPQSPVRQPSVSSKPSSRQHEEGMRSYANDREPPMNERERRYSERERSIDSQRERSRQSQQGQGYSNAGYRNEHQDSYNYNERGQDRPYIEQQRTPREQKQPSSPQELQYSPLYKGSSDLSANPYRPPYYISSPKYKPGYQDQNQYSYDISKPFLFRNLQPAPSNQKYVFRNALPDRLEEFLREETKQDRRTSIKVSLKDK